MSLPRKRAHAAAILASLLGAAAFQSPASAQSGAPAGRLSCSVGPALGLVVTSQRPMECRFTPRRGPVQNYVGVVRSFGLDLGTIRSSGMRWRVYGPYARAQSGALTGRYTGAAVAASAGTGASGNLLVGGNHGDVTLQPLSLQGRRGINVALGVTSFELTPGRRSR